jgi:hypothetical protein
MKDMCAKSVQWQNLIVSSWQNNLSNCKVNVAIWQVLSTLSCQIHPHFCNTQSVATFRKPSPPGRFPSQNLCLCPKIYRKKRKGDKK